MGPTALLPLWRKACWGFFCPKNPTVSVGCEPTNLGTKGQHATSRPPNCYCYCYWETNSVQKPFDCIKQFFSFLFHPGVSSIWHKDYLFGFVPFKENWPITFNVQPCHYYWRCNSNIPNQCHINLLKSKYNLLYIRNQSVPCCKHFPPRL
jgi:hypothetical protein